MSRPVRGVAGVVLGLSAGFGLFGFAASGPAPQARAAFECGASGSQARAGSAPLVHRRARFLLQVDTASSHFAQLEVVTTSGRVIRRVAKVQAGGVQAAVSPDGKLLAWMGAKGLVVERIDGSARRLVEGTGLFAGLYLPNPFVWSPDSKAVLTIDPSGGLAIVSLAAGAKRQVVKPQGQLPMEALAWPRLKTIVFEITGRSSARVVLADPSGSSQHTILRQSIDQTYNVAATVSVSPNRECINLNAEFDSPGDPSTSQFTSVNVLTDQQTRVRPFDAFDLGTIWSPDSSRVVADVSGGPLVIMSPSGKVRTTIRQDWLSSVAWTQSAIYALSGKRGANKLFAIPAGRTTTKVVFKLPRGQEILSAQPF